jgi:DNA damage-binding protein 2
MDLFARLRVKFGEERRREAARYGVCHVCGQSDHRAGFDGVLYRDCLTRPCYLCKRAGHTTGTCPFFSSWSATRTGGGGGGGGDGASWARGVRAREAGGGSGCARGPLGRAHALAPRAPPRAWWLDAGVLGLHARRVTALRWIGGDADVLLSGDRSGELASWRAHEAPRAERSGPEL